MQLLNGNFLSSPLTLEKHPVLEECMKLHTQVPFEADIWTSPDLESLSRFIYFSQSMDFERKMYGYIKKFITLFSGNYAVELSFI